MHRRTARSGSDHLDPPDWELITTQDAFGELLDEWMGVERCGEGCGKEKLFHEKVLSGVARKNCS